jgi:hypothetical protein
VAGLLAGAAGVAWFQPQKLLINQRVDEAPPVAATPTSGPFGHEPAPAGQPTVRS